MIKQQKYSFLLIVFFSISCATMNVRSYEIQYFNPINEVREPDSPVIIEGFFHGTETIDNITYSIYSFENLLKKNNKRTTFIKLPTKPLKGYNQIFIDEINMKKNTYENVKILFINQSDLYSFEKEELDTIKKKYFNSNEYQFIFANAYNNRGIDIHYIDNETQKWSKFHINEDDLNLKHNERNILMFPGLIFMYTGSIIIDILTSPIQGIIYFILYSSNRLIR